MVLLKGSFVHRITLLGLLSLALVLTMFTKGEAQSQQSSLDNVLPIEWEMQREFRPPQRIGRPGNREGGATRGPVDACLKTHHPLMALVPPSGKALTEEAYPSFFWYLPPTSAREVEFILKDENNMEVYSTRYRLKHQDDSKDFKERIMTIALPRNAGIDPLEIGKEYHWELALICNPINRLSDIYVTASIERLAPRSKVSSTIEAATPSEKLGIYADARLWNETLITLLDMERLEPDRPNIEDAWIKLFDSVGLESIYQNALIAEPVCECIQ